ncbi:MAG: glycosyltransferase, partial [Nitrososphaerales archaeon]
MTYRACILLATYNGASWINEQIRSVTCQVGVRVSIVASDDYSDDGTCQILKHWAAQTDLLVLPHASKRFGNANRNFLHLICNAPFNNSDFFAFADQDDIWLPNKVERAIECLVTKGADAYSSDVIAFWPDGRHVPIIRSAPQRQYDY